MCLQPKSRSASPEETPVKLYGAILESSQEETHLGICRTNVSTNTSTVNDRIKSARRTSYGLMGAGFHQLSGVGPEVGRHLHSTYAVPRLIYGLEALILTKPEMDSLELSHRTSLRHIQHLPKSTATASVYLLIGTPPSTSGSTDTHQDYVLLPDPPAKTRVSGVPNH